MSKKKKIDTQGLLKRANQVMNAKTPNWPNFRTGDSIRVHVRVREGDKTRVQIFEGLVIAKRGSGLSQSFTVRKISFGVGVERVFPLYSPVIEKIAVVSAGEVRRAKLYYLRALSGRASRIKSELVFGMEASAQTADSSAAAPSASGDENVLQSKAAEG